MQRRNTDADQARRNARADRASPSTASVGSASSASKNTNRVHDTSALTNRLKHLDDCMRQVKSLIRNLEKSDDPMAHQKLLTLQQMMHQLSVEQSNSDPRRARVGATWSVLSLKNLCFHLSFLLFILLLSLSSFLSFLL